MKFSIIIASLFLVQLAQCQEWKVSGNDLLDPNGKKFLLRGINSNHADWDSYNRHHGRNSLKAISDTGANSVRIVWKPKSSSLTLQDLNNVVYESIKHKMVVVIEYHEATGSPDTKALLEGANWWKNEAIPKVLNNYKRNVIINIANEWSPFGTSYEQWRDAYKQAIAIVRQSGWKGVLMVDGSAYAQNAESILTYGNEVLNSDPERNVIFSLHMYAEWKIGGQRNIGDSLTQIRKKGLAIVIGEFTLHHPEGCKWIKIDAWEIMRQAKAQNVGWMAWSWHGNGKGDCDYDLSQPDKNLNMVTGDASKGETWTRHSFTEFGNAAVHYEGYGIKDTSKRASIY